MREGGEEKRNIESQGNGRSTKRKVLYIEEKDNIAYSINLLTFNF